MIGWLVRPCSVLEFFWRLFCGLLAILRSICTSSPDLDKYALIESFPISKKHKGRNKEMDYKCVFTFQTMVKNSCLIPSRCLLHAAFSWKDAVHQEMLVLKV